jgi:hypothetical protein
MKKSGLADSPFFAPTPEKTEETSLPAASHQKKKAKPNLKDNSKEQQTNQP